MLLCFGADGVSTFQGPKTGVTHQIQSKYAPFALGVHCMAHRCNLAFKTLSQLDIMSRIKGLLKSSHAYFKHSPKRHLEFVKLADLMETKGLKLLKHVKTKWVSLIEPLRRIIQEYRVLLAKMKADNDSKEKSAEAVLDLLCDPTCLIGMCALLPLIECLDSLITFAQKRDVFIYDFIGAVKMCEGQLYSIYNCNSGAFNTDEFFLFKSITEGTHDHIHTRWVQNDPENPAMFDLNCNVEHLAFVVNGSNIFAKRKNEETGRLEPITRETFAAMVNDVKTQCSGVAAQLIQELQRRFPEHAVLDALGVIYPQYWLQPNAEVTFSKHLDTLKNWYCNARVLGTGVDKEVIPGILDRWSLDSQQGYFKIAMKSNAPAAMEPPFDVNPVTRIWRTISASRVLSHGFPEYLKLAEIALVHVIGSVEDERVFSSVSFLKTKLRNSLDPHLGVVVGMYNQNIYTLQNFPYDAVFDSWTNAAPVNGRYGLTA